MNKKNYSAAPRLNGADLRIEEAFDAEKTLRLTLANLNAMREWYRAMPTAGEPMGRNSMMEMSIAAYLTAFELAVQGKSWSAP